LASSAIGEVLACWSGLGYYSRARHLHHAARQMDGSFPRTYEAIRELPGVGDSTAAAIASIAFGLPHAVLDGNVMRVVARLTNDAGDIGSSRTRARLRATVGSWLDPQRPGPFNQALMELGARVCLPRTPHCGMCPLAGLCAARHAQTAAQLPVNLRKAKPVKIQAAVVIVEHRGRILFWQRPASSRRMADFWELPTPDQLSGLQAPRIVGTFRHTITQQHYEVTVWIGALARAKPPLVWLPVADLDSVALSTTARKALRLGAQVCSARPGVPSQDPSSVTPSSQQALPRIAPRR
jgi:A/G-specific adenine glycosylase